MPSWQWHTAHYEQSPRNETTLPELLDLESLFNTTGRHERPANERWAFDDLIASLRRLMRLGSDYCSQSPSQDVTSVCNLSVLLMVELASFSQPQSD
ncbi:hypothetical protein PPACK8108_LOCUS12661 [Phakopsora pachyrhizi]|uniref:Uncharacterized protein n=1 Tax=Phakopsora pachyrhizi TaxID=170000 RepID=A0AAV0B718_PHAPC|nr:hypothetical protein PPACK8108_LOCUS12661 [Phakopsora pachyrhizi]